MTTIGPFALLAVVLFGLGGCATSSPRSSPRHVPASLQRHALPPVGKNTDLRLELHAPGEWRRDFEKTLKPSMVALLYHLVWRDAHRDGAWLGGENWFVAGGMKIPDYFSWYTLAIVKKTPQMVEATGGLTTWERTRVGIWPIPLYDDIGPMQNLCVEAIVRFDLRSERDTNQLEQFRNLVIHEAGR